MRREVIPIIIPVFNTSPETIYLVVTYLHCTTKNPVVIVNDGSNRDETIQVLHYISLLERLDDYHQEPLSGFTTLSTIYDSFRVIPKKVKSRQVIC